MGQFTVGIVRAIGLVIAASLLFQNCSPVDFGGAQVPSAVNQSVDQIAETLQDTLTREGGSGEWYNGILFSEVVNEGGGGEDNKVRTVVSYVSATNHFWLLRSNCQDVEPVLLPDVAVVFNNATQDSIIYEGVILTTSPTQTTFLFSNPGSFAWPKPSSGNVAVFECWGAGGGASVGGTLSEGWGGGGGAYASGIVNLNTLNAVMEVVVGAGGAGGQAFGYGQPGGDSRILGMIAGGGHAGAFTEFTDGSSTADGGNGGKGTGKQKNFGKGGLFPQDSPNGGCSTQGCPSGGNSGDSKSGGRGGFLGGEMNPGGNGQSPGGGGGGGGRRRDGSSPGGVGGGGGNGAHGQCRITVIF